MKKFLYERQFLFTIELLFTGKSREKYLANVCFNCIIEINNNYRKL